VFGSFQEHSAAGVKALDNAYDGTKETDRRRATRRSSGASMWADPGGVLPVIDCKIIDMTETGAMVRAQSGGALPDRFILQKETTNILGEAHVVWRNGNLAGVKLQRA
jgi:hypothetical protein